MVQLYPPTFHFKFAISKQKYFHLYLVPRTIRFVCEIFDLYIGVLRPLLYLTIEFSPSISNFLFLYNYSYYFGTSELFWMGSNLGKRFELFERNWKMGNVLVPMFYFIRRSSKFLNTNSQITRFYQKFFISS